MNKIAVCFTPQGEDVIARLNDECARIGIGKAKGYVIGERGDVREGFIHVGDSLSEWTKTMFIPGNALIFVGAVGIAVRALSNLVKDKLSDCPVIVIDDNAQFVIPILSGHVGGANKLAVMLADILGAVPVITTSTDVNDAFSVDSFAAENRLMIADRDKIKRVSVKAIEGKKITLSIKGFPPKDSVDVIASDDMDSEYSLVLKPREYTVGIGLKRGKEPEELEKFLPYVDNWATCDQMSPKIFKKHREILLIHIKKWITSGKTYSVRFGVGMLMEHFLDEDYDSKYPEMVAKLRSKEYYVNMMIAWYFATALAKQYESILPYIEEKRLDDWTHNKAIQKSVESRRITEEQKTYLKSLKVRNA